MAAGYTLLHTEKSLLQIFKITSFWNAIFFSGIKLTVWKILRSS